MSEYKIDEEELESAVNATKDLIKGLEYLVKVLADKNEDIFARYMAYYSSRTAQKALYFASKLDMDLRVAGYDIHSEVLQTEQAKEQGWGAQHIDTNPFFISTSEEKKEESASDQLKEFLRHFIESDSKSQEQ